MVQKDVFTSILTRLFKVFRAPNHLDPDNKVQMVGVLQAYEEASKPCLPLMPELEELTYQVILARHRGWEWPTPGEIAWILDEMKKEAYKNRVGD